MFEVLKYQRINAFAYLHNIGSQRVLEKAGFEKVGIKPSFLTKDGLPIDVVAFKKMAVQKNINSPD
jgi:RimJ/RimL family protein N-acetyltransferase